MRVAIERKRLRRNAPKGLSFNRLGVIVAYERKRLRCNAPKELSFNRLDVVVAFRCPVGAFFNDHQCDSPLRGAGEIKKILNMLHLRGWGWIFLQCYFFFVYLHLSANYADCCILLNTSVSAWFGDDM